ERWDGSGYPAGLVGAAIPMGARILAVADCLDALTSDRQYRRAAPLAEAFQRIAAGAGTRFDPMVVEALGRRFSEIERLAGGAGRPGEFEPLIAAARQEAQLMFEVSQIIGRSRLLEEYVSDLSECIRLVIRYDAMTVRFASLTYT